MNNNYKHTVATTRISPTSLKADGPIAPEASLGVNIFKRHKVTLEMMLKSYFQGLLNGCSGVDQVKLGLVTEADE